MRHSRLFRALAGTAGLAGCIALLAGQARAEAIQFAIDIAQAGDVVASFGKGHERSMCYGETEYPWSDQEAMGQAHLTQHGGCGRPGLGSTSHRRAILYGGQAGAPSRTAASCR